MNYSSASIGSVELPDKSQPLKWISRLTCLHRAGQAAAAAAPPRQACSLSDCPPLSISLPRPLLFTSVSDKWLTEAIRVAPAPTGSVTYGPDTDGLTHLANTPFPPPPVMSSKQAGPLAGGAKTTSVPGMGGSTDQDERKIFFFPRACETIFAKYKNAMQFFNEKLLVYKRVF